MPGSPGRPAGAVGYLLACASIDKLCFLYFLLAPLFLDRLDRAAANLAFVAGYALAGLIACLALAERAATLSDRVSLNRFSLSVIGLVGLCFLSLAVNTPEKLFQPGALFVKYLKLVFPVIAFFVMINIWTARDLPKLYTALVAIGWLSVLFLAVEIAGSFANPLASLRFGSFFDEPNRYALFLNVLYGMSLPKLIDDHLKGRRIGLQLAAIGALFLILLLTQSRGGMVIWIAVSAVCFWPRPARPLIAKLLPVLVLAAGVIGTVALARYASTSSNAAQSDLGRVWTYLIAYNIILEKPFIGVGFANVLDSYGQFGGIYQILIGKPLSIHNATLEIFAEEGVFAAILFLGVIFIPVAGLVSRIRARAPDRYPLAEIAVLTVPVAFFGYGLFYPSFLSDDYFWAYMVLPVIVLRSGVPEGFEYGLTGPRLL